MRQEARIRPNPTNHSDAAVVRSMAPLLVFLWGNLVWTPMAAAATFRRPLVLPRVGSSSGIHGLQRFRNDNADDMARIPAKQMTNPILWTVPRGGGFMDEASDDEEAEDDDEDFLLGDDFDDADFVAESEFAEDSTLERAMDAFVKTPPLTKAYLTGSLVATLYGYIFNKNQFPAFLSLEWKPVLTKLQIWRPLTAFFNFGPFGIGYLMTAHFVWTYMATLERLSHKAPYDFWIMILFGQLSMVLGYPLLKLSPRFLGHNLSTFLVYIWARYHEGLEVNLFELFNTRAELLPWFFLAQTFLLEGEPPVLDFLGIVFGHIYHYCKTIGLLRAPPALVAWYQDSTSPWVESLRQQYKQISGDFEMI